MHLFKAMHAKSLVAVVINHNFDFITKTTKGQQNDFFTKITKGQQNFVVNMSCQFIKLYNKESSCHC